VLKRIAPLALLTLGAPATRAQAQTPTPTPTSPPAAASTATPAPPPAAPASTPVPAPAGAFVDAKVAGQDVPVPARKKYVAPEYPAAAASEGIRGIVILDVLIGEDGKVETTRVTRSIPGLDDAATNAVRAWEYEPTKLAGKAVKVKLSQSITFALKLPEIQRAPGIPELKSGGAPPVPAALAAAESASVMVALGPAGEIAEAAVVEGSPAAGEVLMRAVRAWRFSVAPGAAPLVFTIRADWAPGPPPTVTLKALDPRNLNTAAPVAPQQTSSQAPPAPAPQATPAVGSGSAAGSPTTPPSSTPTAPPLAAPNPAAPLPPAAAPQPTPLSTPDVDTDVIPARQEPAAKEEGVSAISDVILGENIPDLVRGRRPVWPPLARLGNITGDVVVRFSVDIAGHVTVHSTEGPDILKPAAEQAVGTWTFRRSAIDRVNLVATFKYGADRSFAKVERVVQP
jgi:TonB family protein